MPNIKSKAPAATSKYFVCICFSFPPTKNPMLELIKVIPAISNAGFVIKLPYKEREIPAENASIEVAIP